VTLQYPQLNILINNAGIMRNVNLQSFKYGIENITDEIEINLSGAIRMVHQFLPHLKTNEPAAIINISLGLAFVSFPISTGLQCGKSRRSCLHKSVAASTLKYQGKSI
jgi:uncharacterized oxidoreductase